MASYNDIDQGRRLSNNESQLMVGGSSLKLVSKDMLDNRDLIQKNINNFAAKNDDGTGHNIHDIATLRKTLMMMKSLHRRRDHRGEAASGSGGGEGTVAGGRRVPAATPLLPPEYLGSSRPPSFLERALLPRIKQSSSPQSPTSIGDPTETSQLTIFYAGMINVYDNVPADKAQAIMLLASRCSVEPPQVHNNVASKVDLVTNNAKPIPKSHSPSLANTHEDLPIARRQSLRRFLEKRRDRIGNKFPYAYSDGR